MQEDPPISTDDIIGLYKARIPKLGDFALFLQQPLRNGGVYRCSGMRLYYYRYYSPQPQQGNGRKRAAQGRA